MIPLHVERHERSHVLLKRGGKQRLVHAERVRRGDHARIQRVLDGAPGQVEQESLVGIGEDAGLSGRGRFFGPFRGGREVRMESDGAVADEPREVARFVRACGVVQHRAGTAVREHPQCGADRLASADGRAGFVHDALEPSRVAPADGVGGVHVQRARFRLGLLGEGLVVEVPAVVDEIGADHQQDVVRQERPQGVGERVGGGSAQTSRDDRQDRELVEAVLKERILDLRAVLESVDAVVRAEHG